MILEHHDRMEVPANSTDRSFGIVFGVFFLAVALLPLLAGRPMRFWALIPCCTFLLIAFTKPSVLSPLNKLWGRFGLLLHTIFNPIILAVVFFLVLTPTALIRKLFGKKSLDLAYEPDSDSYWIERDAKDSAKHSMTVQF